MKILKAKVENFGSYKALEFDFAKQDLALVYGPTGSGKSTLQDVIPWCLYGITAKNGSVDDVINWTDTGIITKGEIDVHTKGKTVTVTRIRRKSGASDLYWVDSDFPNVVNRGRDLKDTQKQISSLMGCTQNGFLTCTYFHEFSRTNTFFTANSKDRRLLLSDFTDWSFTDTLTDRLRKYRIATEGTVSSNERTLQKEILRKEMLQQEHKKLEKAKEEWRVKRQQEYTSVKKQKEADIRQILDSITAIELESPKALVDELSVRYEEAQTHNLCKECGSAKTTNELISLKTELLFLKNKVVQSNSEIMVLKSQLRYKQTELKALEQQDERDIFSSQIRQIEESQVIVSREIAELNAKADNLKLSLLNCDILAETIEQYKINVLTSTVACLENETNALIEKFFDGEFRVLFKLENSDTISVEITNNGVACSYSQLSKGQRQILNLCFGVSAMKASARNLQVQTSVLMFDEALDGMDTNLKLKSYNLFDSLKKDYDSILVIDHSPELHTMFSTQYRVSLIDGYSHIEHN